MRNLCHQVSRVGLPRGEEREFEITPMADAAVRGYLGIIEVIVGYGGQINAINEVSLSLALLPSLCSLPLFLLPLITHIS